MNDDWKYHQQQTNKIKDVEMKSEDRPATGMIGDIMYSGPVQHLQDSEMQGEDRD
jgi:hypothetical protein